MNPSLDDGNPPRPFRHLRVAEHRSPDLSSSRVPVHSVLVQKSVTTITNAAGRLSIWMLGKTQRIGKWKTVKSWQEVCNQSNVTVPLRYCQAITGGAAQWSTNERQRRSEVLDSADLWSVYTFLSTPVKEHAAASEQDLETSERCQKFERPLLQRRWRSLASISLYWHSDMPRLLLRCGAICWEPLAPHCLRR